MNEHYKEPVNGLFDDVSALVLKALHDIGSPTSQNPNQTWKLTLQSDNLRVFLIFLENHFLFVGFLQ